MQELPVPPAGDQTDSPISLKTNPGPGHGPAPDPATASPRPGPQPLAAQVADILTAALPISILSPDSASHHPDLIAYRKQVAGRQQARLASLHTNPLTEPLSRLAALDTPPDLPARVLQEMDREIAEETDQPGGPDSPDSPDLLDAPDQPSPVEIEVTSPIIPPRQPPRAPNLSYQTLSHPSYKRRAHRRPKSLASSGPDWAHNSPVPAVQKSALTSPSALAAIQSLSIHDIDPDNPPIELFIPRGTRADGRPAGDLPIHLCPRNQPLRLNLTGLYSDPAQTLCDWWGLLPNDISAIASKAESFALSHPESLPPNFCEPGTPREIHWVLCQRPALRPRPKLRSRPNSTALTYLQTRKIALFIVSRRIRLHRGAIKISMASTKTHQKREKLRLRDEKRTILQEAKRLARLKSRQNPINLESLTREDIDLWYRMKTKRKKSLKTRHFVETLPFRNEIDRMLLAGRSVEEIRTFAASQGRPITVAQLNRYSKDRLLPALEVVSSVRTGAAIREMNQMVQELFAKGLEGLELAKAKTFVSNYMDESGSPKLKIDQGDFQSMLQFMKELRDLTRLEGERTGELLPEGASKAGLVSPSVTARLAHLGLPAGSPSPNPALPGAHPGSPGSHPGSHAQITHNVALFVQPRLSPADALQARQALSTTVPLPTPATLTAPPPRPALAPPEGDLAPAQDPIPSPPPPPSPLPPPSQSPASPPSDIIDITPEPSTP